ncbi:MAG TPA: shikimate kinase [Solirubrobacteraceae bacterium]
MTDPAMTNPTDETAEARLRDAHAQVRADRLSRHIAFIGFMGAGKSTMAELIAARLGRAWFDTDRVVVERCGRSIPDLFAAGEQAAFRALEKQVIAELLMGEPAVISLGGGALEDLTTRDALFDQAFVVNLAVSWRDVQVELPTLMRTRPLLQDRSEGEIHQLFLRRQATYRKAHLRIRVPRGDLDAAADYVLSVVTG